MTTKNENFSGTLGEYTQLFSSAATISGGQLIGVAADEVGVFHSSGSYGNDQRASIAVRSADPQYYSVHTRVVFTSVGIFNSYGGVVGSVSGDAYINVHTGSSAVEIVSGGIGRALTTSDVIELSSVGTQHTLRINGEIVLSTSDATFSAGKPGVVMFSEGTPVAAIDDAVFSDVFGGINRLLLGVG